MPASTSSSAPELWAVVLAGGVGSRFWPVSTPTRPKQILPLGSEQPLVADTVARLSGLVPMERVRILAGTNLAPALLAAVPNLDARTLMLEPRARGTAPVLVWAAHEIARADENAIMCSLHADHSIEPADAFRAQLSAMARIAASERRLLTIGIAPTRPETGYGYIRVGPALGTDADAFEVAEFVEKPAPEIASAYVASGDYLWNSGIFVWRAADLLDEVRRHTPELARLLPLLDSGDVDVFFEQAPSLSIDEGVLERSRRVGVVRAGFAWDDVGTWEAVTRTRTSDARGNIAIGDTVIVDGDDNIGWSESGSLVLFGLHNVIAVHAHGVTLVMPRERAADLKELLQQLPARLRDLNP